MKKIVALLLAVFILISMLIVYAVAETAPATDDFSWPDPKKTITINVCYAPGNSHDIMCRTMQPYLEKVLGCKVQIENIAGGSGLVCLKQMMEVEPDGYTITTWAHPKHDVESVISSTGEAPFYSYDDWRVIGTVNPDTHIVVVPKDSPFNTMQELIDAAKARPGELFWSGTGTAPGVCSLCCDAICDGAGVEFVYVPYGGGEAEVVAAILGGHTDVACLGIGGVYSNYVLTGEMKSLGIISNERNRYAPDLPTMKEAIGIELESHVGSVIRLIVCSSKIDERIIKILQDAVKTVSEDPEFIAAYEATGNVVEYVLPEDCEAARLSLVNYFKAQQQ